MMSARHGERQDPLRQDGFKVDADHLQGREREPHQDGAAQRQQCVVDGELTGEPGEVHAAAVGTPTPSGVRHPSQQPQDHRGVQDGEQLGGTAGGEGVDVDHDRQHGEGDQQHRRHARREPAGPHKVAGKEREDQQAEVARLGCAVVEPGHSGLDRNPGPDGERQDHGQLAPRWRAGVVGLFRDEHELLPQPVGVLAGKLARDGVEVAQAFDGHEEGLLVIEPGRLAVGDLLAEVVLQLVDVGGGDRLAALDVPAPLLDLGLKFRVLHHAHPTAGAGGCCAACHTWRSAAATTDHCCCRLASSSRPAGVIA